MYGNPYRVNIVVIQYNEVKSNQEEVEAMCREVEAYAERRAKEAAVRQLIETGLKYGVSKKKLATDLMVDHHLTEEEASAALQKYGAN